MFVYEGGAIVIGRVGVVVGLNEIVGLAWLFVPSVKFSEIYPQGDAVEVVFVEVVGLVGLVRVNEECVVMRVGG